MCQGYHRRQVEKWQHTRWLGLEIHNSLRPPGEPGKSLHKYLPLPGDAQPVGSTAEEIAALWAELDSRDANIL